MKNNFENHLALRYKANDNLQSEGSYHTLKSDKDLDFYTVCKLLISCNFYLVSESGL